MSDTSANPLRDLWKCHEAELGAMARELLAEAVGSPDDWKDCLRQARRDLAQNTRIDLANLTTDTFGALARRRVEVNVRRRISRIRRERRERDLTRFALDVAVAKEKARPALLKLGARDVTSVVQAKAQKLLERGLFGIKYRTDRQLINLLIMSFVNEQKDRLRQQATYRKHLTTMARQRPDAVNMAEDELFVQKELADRVRSVIASMKPVDRAILDAHMTLDGVWQDIADQLRLGVSQAKMRHNRALMRLREECQQSLSE